LYTKLSTSPVLVTEARSRLDAGGGHDREWLAKAYDAFGAKLFRYAFMITARRDLAEDAVQQAFARMLDRGIPREIASAEAFMRTVVRNEAYRLLERQSRPALAIEFLLEPAPDPGDQALADEERQRLEHAIRLLTPEQRELIHLKVYEGLTFAQIGEMLRIPLNTAASRYRYAIEALKETLGAKHDEPR
jgi:RNA polymerase sigma-70 factor (ECF subfamily)